MTSEAHVRIDEGVKRGPRNKPSQAVAHVRRSEILEALRAGALVKDVAEALQVTGEAISQQLANDPEYREARAHGIAERLENHYEQMQTAPDALSLARGREAWRAATWFAEREFPERWGQKQEITHQVVQPILQITVVAEKPARVIDAETPLLTSDECGS